MQVHLEGNGLTDEFVDVLARVMADRPDGDGDGDGDGNGGGGSGGGPRRSGSGDEAGARKSVGIRLRHLHLASNSIRGTTDGFEKLLSGVVGLQIEYLGLDSNRIENLLPVLGDNCLTNLDVAMCDIGPASVAAFADWLGSDNSVLEFVRLDYNEVMDEGAIAIATALGRNSTLISLSLQFCGLSGSGGIALATAIKTRNRTLETVQSHQKKKYIKNQTMT